jgi:RNA polymerase sigma-70 factor, ECF subfamily
MDDDEEALCVLRAQSGDRDALDGLFRAMQQPLFRYLVGLVGRRELAEDILQEVFLQIYRKLVWLRDVGLFRPWAYRITTRIAFRRLHQERRRSALSAGDGPLRSIPSPASREEYAEQRAEDFHRLAERASPASRAVLVLYYLHGLSLEEVADVLGLAMGTVKSRLSYGLSVLRDASRPGHPGTDDPD